MSRILDALKKAEQEKLPQSLSPETVKAESAVGPEGGDREDVAPMSGPAAATPEARAGMSNTALETLLEACPRHAWNADFNLAPDVEIHRHHLVSEELRSLRSRLYLMRKRRPLRKLLVTSPLPREGKSFIAAHLAHTCAKQQASRILLIDSDLRVSSLHKVLGVPLNPGLSAYLSGSAELDFVLQRGSPDNLFFITAGERPENPTELLGNGRLESLLSRLAPAFDWIILDSPPAVPVSDARLLAQFCDGVLMLIHAGTTPFDLAQKACQEFASDQLLGVVLNRAEVKFSYGGYYYGRQP